MNTSIMLFENLALPNLKKNQHRQLNEFKTHRAGFTSNGVPANISVVRSLQNSLARRTAMTAGKRRELRALEEDSGSHQPQRTGAAAGGGAPAQRDCRTAG